LVSWEELLSQGALPSTFPVMLQYKLVFETQITLVYIPITRFSTKMSNHYYCTRQMGNHYEVIPRGIILLIDSYVAIASLVKGGDWLRRDWIFKNIYFSGLMVVALFFCFKRLSLPKGHKNQAWGNTTHAMQLSKMSDPSHKRIINKQRLAIKLLW